MSPCKSLSVGNLSSLSEMDKDQKLTTDPKSQSYPGLQLTADMSGLQGIIGTP